MQAQSRLPSYTADVEVIEVSDFKRGTSITELYVCRGCGQVTYDTYRIKRIGDPYSCGSHCRYCNTSHNTVDTPWRCEHCDKSIDCLYSESPVSMVIAMSQSFDNEYALRVFCQEITQQWKDYTR